ncbi:MAG: DUF1491 family protein [Pseudomonadota bacterium]
MDARLPTQLWVKARLALWNKTGFPAVLRRRGDQYGGTIILCVDRLDGTADVLGQQRSIEGVLSWVRLGAGTPMTSEEERAYIERAAARDRDVWVIGVEALSGWPPLDEPVDAD